MPVENFPDPSPNATTQAVALAKSRAAMHDAAGTKLVALVLTEYLEHPGNPAVESILGYDLPHDGKSIRQCGASGKDVRQVVIVGSVPPGSYAPSFQVGLPPVDG